MSFECSCRKTKKKEKRKSGKKVFTKKNFVSKNELEKANIFFVSKDSAAKIYIGETKENFKTLLLCNAA